MDGYLLRLERNSRTQWTITLSKATRTHQNASLVNNTDGPWTHGKLVVSPAWHICFRQQRASMRRLAVEMYWASLIWEIYFMTHTPSTRTSAAKSHQTSPTCLTPLGVLTLSIVVLVNRIFSVSLTFGVLFCLCFQSEHVCIANCSFPLRAVSLHVS